MRYATSFSTSLATNAAIFVALGYVTGRPWLALGSFLALTALLSANFNLDRLARGAEAMPPGGGLLGRVYGLIYAPQDRVCERLFTVPRGRRALTLVANSGLSTQLADAIGALVTLQGTNRVWVDEVRSGSSYNSSSDLRLHFGLGTEKQLKSIQVRWPNGNIELFDPPALDHIIDVVEGKGRPATP